MACDVYFESLSGMECLCFLLPRHLTMERSRTTRKYRVPLIKVMSEKRQVEGLTLKEDTMDVIDEKTRDTEVCGQHLSIISVQMKISLMA